MLKVASGEVDRGEVSAIRRFLSDRAALVSLSASACGRALVGVVGVMIFLMLLAPAMAVAFGILVGRVLTLASAQGDREPATMLVPVLATLAVLFALELLAPTIAGVLREWVTGRVEGNVRALVDGLVGASAEPLPEPLRQATALAVSGGQTFGLASAAEGQLWLVARYIGGVASALVLACFSVPAALVALAAMLGHREILRRDFAVPYAARAETVIEADNATASWRDVASGVVASAGTREFEPVPWVHVQHARSEQKSVESLVSVFERAMPRLWVTFALSALAIAAPFAMLGHAALTGTLSMSDLVIGLGAAVAVLPLGALGDEAYSLAACGPKLAALGHLQRCRPRILAEGPETAPLARGVRPRSL